MLPPETSTGYLICMHRESPSTRGSRAPIQGSGSSWPLGRCMVETGCTRLQFTMATQALPCRGVGNDPEKFAISTIDQVSSHHEAWPKRSRLTSERHAQVHDVDISPADRANRSRSGHSANSASRISGPECPSTMARRIRSIDELGGEQEGDGESELIDLPDDARRVKALAFLALE